MRNVIYKNRFNAPVSVNCPQHGQARWLGTIACSECGRVFQALSPKVAAFATPRCPCGAVLLPPSPKATDFSAVWICFACFALGFRSGGRLARLSKDVAVIMNGHETKAR